MKGCNILLAGVLSFGTFGNAIADLNSGLVAYYPFNGNANDESGNNHHGIVTRASLTKDKGGVSNSAYFFNGDSYITIENTPSLNFNADFSISFWIKNESPSSTTDEVEILSKRSICAQDPFFDIPEFKS